MKKALGRLTAKPGWARGGQKLLVRFEKVEKIPE
jgi:hypothetical protein